MARKSRTFWARVGNWLVTLLAMFIPVVNIGVGLYLLYKFLVKGKMPYLEVF